MTRVLKRQQSKLKQHLVVIKLKSKLNFLTYERSFLENTFRMTDFYVFPNYPYKTIVDTFNKSYNLRNHGKKTLFGPSKTLFGPSRSLFKEKCPRNEFPRTSDFFRSIPFFIIKFLE